MKEVTYNSSLLKDSWNSNETVKPNNFNELSGAVKKVVANANDLAHNYLQQGKQYVVGDIVYSKNLNKGRYLLCTQGGTTGDSEPQLINKNVGETVTDGSVVWTVQNIRTTALDAYPVGSIYMSVNSTSPAILFGGTWEAMPAGRVLLAQGESQWGTTYAAGSTGGEATHLLTPEEMPRHKHDAVANNVNISGTAYLQMGNGVSIATGSTTGVFSAIGSGTVEGYGSGSRSGTNGLKFNSTHTPTISISYTGADTAHNNLQPFIAVFMWRRTA